MNRKMEQTNRIVAWSVNKFLKCKFSYFPSHLQRHRKLYIFGGQRNKEYATDFISYDVDTQNISVVNTDEMKSDRNNVPQAGFTQRATIDCERDEIYVLSVSLFEFILN